MPQVPERRPRRRRSPGRWVVRSPGLTLDRADRRVLALLARAAERGDRTTIPSGALAQAVRDPARQARLARLLRLPTTEVVPLDRHAADAIGRLLAATGTADVVDAQVVLCALRTGQRVLTSDPRDLARLAPDLPIAEL